jgi:hypothetical protein
VIQSAEISPAAAEPWRTKTKTTKRKKGERAMLLFELLDFFLKYITILAMPFAGLYLYFLYG